MGLQLQSALGLIALPLIAWALSENRRALSGRVIAAGLGLQFAIALLLLKVPGSATLFVWLNDAFLALNEAAKTGTGVVFGYLGGGPLPFAESHPGASFILAFQALPIILLMSALSALLFHWGILQVIVAGFSWLLRRVFGIGGAVGVATAANIFVGMVEAPLLVRPYLARLTRSELFMVMTTGMATIAGTVLVLYAGFLAATLNGAVGHLVTASVISAPAAILIAWIMVPPAFTAASGSAECEADATSLEGSRAQSAMDAITRGTAAGLSLYLNILALLIVFIALVSLVNQALTLLPDVAGAPMALERILGWIFAPLVFLIGIPWQEAATAGSLMGIKTVLNEFLAYLELSKLPAEVLSDRSRLVMTYALCGFANFGSLAIMLGGLTTMVPERRGELVELGLRSIASGTLATLMTGAVVGVLTPT
ncbi:MAG: nucleoside:proton symporter [Alphaproteobacteria bacterium BRH_c36]|nr:MAG: nucleoside:proton symporter [Alphaproteobacteria bacterium BRH_c36]